MSFQHLKKHLQPNNIGAYWLHKTTDTLFKIIFCVAQKSEHKVLLLPYSLYCNSRSVYFSTFFYFMQLSLWVDNILHFSWCKEVWVWVCVCKKCLSQWSCRLILSDVLWPRPWPPISCVLLWLLLCDIWKRHVLFSIFIHFIFYISNLYIFRC